MPRPPLPERLTAQALAGEPLRSAEQVAARLLAVQGQDPRGARLAVRVRTEGITAADIDRALVEEGPLTRPQLRECLDAAGVPTAGQALVHLLFLATLRGIAVRGPMVGKEHAYVLVRDWLGEPKPIDREQALAEPAHRYLVGHAPADERDVCSPAPDAGHQ